MNTLEELALNPSAELDMWLHTPADVVTFFALYRKDNPRRPLSRQARNGLCRALLRFRKAQYEGCDPEMLIILRRVMKLVHPKPHLPEQEKALRFLVHTREVARAKAG